MRTLVRTLCCREKQAWRETSDLQGMNAHAGGWNYECGWDVLQAREAERETHRHRHTDWAPLTDQVYLNINGHQRTSRKFPKRGSGISASSLVGIPKIWRTKPGMLSLKHDILYNGDYPLHKSGLEGYWSLKGVSGITSCET